MKQWNKIGYCLPVNVLRLILLIGSVGFFIDGPTVLGVDNVPVCPTCPPCYSCSDPLVGCTTTCVAPSSIPPCYSWLGCPDCKLVFICASGWVCCDGSCHNPALNDPDCYNQKVDDSLVASPPTTVCVGATVPLTVEEVVITETFTHDPCNHLTTGLTLTTTDTSFPISFPAPAGSFVVNETLNHTYVNTCARHLILMTQTTGLR